LTAVGAAGVVVSANTGGAAAAAAAAATTLVDTYAGTAKTLANGANLVVYTGAATTEAGLLAILNANALTYGTANATAGQFLLINYLSSVDSTVHVAAVTLAAVQTTATASAVTDIVLTGQTSNLTATNYAFIA